MPYPYSGFWKNLPITEKILQIDGKSKIGRAKTEEVMGLRQWGFTCIIQEKVYIISFNFKIGIWG